MAITLPGTNIPLLVPGLPNFTPPTPKKLDDVTVKDEKIKLSELLRKTGWGQANSHTNKVARGVIRCESNADTEAENRTPCAPGEHAVGLMQVCTNHRGTKGIPRDLAKAVEFLKDPEKNLTVARQILRTQGWGAWTCAKVETSWDPEITLHKGSLTDTVEKTADPLLAPLDAVADFFGLLTQADTWLRVGKVWFGGVTLTIGLVALVFVGGKAISKSKVGRIAMAATPVGRGASIVKAAGK